METVAPDPRRRTRAAQAMRLPLQSPQTSWPQRRQWCRRRVSVNAALHRRQLELLESRIHSGDVAAAAAAMPALAPPPAAPGCTRMSPSPACGPQAAVTPRRAGPAPPPPGGHAQPAAASAMREGCLVGKARKKPNSTARPPVPAACAGGG